MKLSRPEHELHVKFFEAGTPATYSAAGVRSAPGGQFSLLDTPKNARVIFPTVHGVL